MGLGSITFNMVVAGIALSVVCALAIGYSDINKAELDLKSREIILEDRARSAILYVGFNSTNTTETDINVTVYVRNSGSTSMLTRCCDLIVDDTWISKNNLHSSVVPSVFDTMVWNPTETLLLSRVSAIDVGEHNFTFISCIGDRVAGRFNASVCGDGVCLGGEYCQRDDIACDLKCYNTLCAGGCVQTLTPAGEKDNLGLVCNETGGCGTNSCLCDGAGTCCGAVGSSCAQGSECCSGSCSDVCI